MRILHAADLHLGRSFHERDLGLDQAHMLEALLEAAVAAPADILLLAGDIYDRAIPQPEAIALFDCFLTRVKEAMPALVVVAIPGNHDSATRLSFGAGILSRSGLHIRSRAEDVTEPIVVERNGERCAVWALPYLNPGAFAAAATPPSRTPSGAALATPPATAGQGELFPEAAESDAAREPAIRSQASLFSEAMSRIVPLLDPAARNVLLAHCFATGGTPSESERAFIGAAEEVPNAHFESFDYVALGHLHRRQTAGPKGRYPGSPLAYSFAEAESSPEKGFLLVDLPPRGEGGGGADFAESFIVVEPLRRVTRLSGSFAELSAPGAHAAHREDYVEARLTDPLPVLDPADALRANFPNLLAIRQAAFEIAPAGGDRPARAGAPARSDAGGEGAVLEDFRAFHAEMHGAPPDSATEEAFALLLKEAEHAAD